MDFSKMTIDQVRTWFNDDKNKKQIKRSIKALELDERQGIKLLVDQWKTKERKYKEQKDHWDMMNKEERSVRNEGFKLIVGIDEVGRGSLAGPVVAAAVILADDFYLPGINDSKQLSPTVRDEYATYIKEQALAYSISQIDAFEIDKINIYQATLKAMHKAINELQPSPDYALIDAVNLSLSIPSKPIIKGDQKSVSIAAASILAKVYRDELMRDMALIYDGYGFERNAGYGTKEHLEAIQRIGITDIHRRSFFK